MSNARTLALLVLLASTASCDDSFSPFVNDLPDPPHVLNGILDSAADTQFVRLEIVRQMTVVDPPALDEVRLTSNSVSSGPIEWTDSLVVLDNGAVAHLFSTTTGPRPGEAISLIATGPGERLSVVNRTLPVRPRLVVSPPVYAQGAITQTVRLVGIDIKPDELFLDYSIFDHRGMSDRILSISYTSTSGQRRPDGWEFVLNLLGDRFAIAALTGIGIDQEIRLYSVALRMTEFGPEWDSRRPSDIGFIGTIGRYVLPLTLDAPARDSLNYSR